ncbi:uncharacterized protein LOC123507249 [Portunus trituberculatus]|uniref:uncharacterized protein LOC123507249 n=1 Tax=Portunus trituberculatus TaxID=210409 RepID=UPI001E1CB9AC|nr:uncharacterized protein LOC123507249 [Portunus trituberculatus]
MNSIENQAAATEAAAAGGQSPLLTAALTLLSRNHSWTDLLDSLGRSGEVSWLGFLYSVVSVVFVTMLAPALKVFLLTLVAATLRITAFYFFGEENMGKVVGSEGYIYYAKVLLGNYLGYGPILHLLNRPQPDAQLL